MSFLPLHRMLSSRSRHNRKGPCRLKGKGGRTPLRLERLEERTLLSVTFNPDPYGTPFIPAEVGRGGGGIWGSPVEPQIAVNPTNPTNVVLSSQNVMEVSNDGGATYGPLKVFPVPLPGEGGDTSTVFDSQGRLFWSIDAQNTGDPFSTPYVVQVNPTTGATIGTAHRVNAPPNNASGDDKDVLGTDGTNLYIVWERFFPQFVGDGSHDQVLLSRSSDQGQNWSAPVVVSDANFNEGHVWGSTVSALSDGSISVAYHADANNGEVLVARYTNDLSSLLSKRTVMTNVTVPQTFPSEPWNSNNGTIGDQIAWVIGDPTRSGQVYVLFLNDQYVTFAKSTDFGDTWTNTFIVGGFFPGNFNTFPTAAIDSLGNLAVTWYNNGAGNKDSSGNYLLDLRAMYSTDGGSTWSPSFQVNQAHHFDPLNDPSANRIDDYFGISLFAGTVYIAWEGNTFDASGNVTGNQVETSTFGLKGWLAIQDDSSVSNTITIADVPNNVLAAEVVVNGQTQYAGAWTSLSSINVADTFSSANDTINIENTFFFGPVMGVQEGSGTDTVNISPFAQNLNDISAPFNVFGGSGVDTVNIDDQNDTGNVGWTVTPTSVQRTLSGIINYTGQTDVQINGGSGASFGVYRTSPANTTINVEPGSGVSVYGTGGPLNIINPSNLFAVVTIGSGGSLPNIAGQVNVSGPFDMFVDDSGDTSARTGIVTSGSITGLSAPAAITYTPGNNSLLTVFGGNGGNTFNVYSTGLGMTTRLILSGANTVNVTNTGLVQSIAGPLSIEAPQGANTIVIDDSADTTPRTETMSTGPYPYDSENNDPYTFINGLAPATIAYENADTSQAIIKTPLVAHSVMNVQSTSVTTNLVGSAAMTVNIGSAGSVQGILGTLNIENPPSSNNINIDDSADTVSRTITVSNLGTTAADSEGDVDIWGQISGLAPAPINFEYGFPGSGHFDTASVTVRTGSGGDTVNVLGTGVPTNLVGDSPMTVNVGNAGNLQGIQGSLNIENPTGSNTIVIDDSADTTARTVALSTLGTNTADSEGNTHPWGQILGLAPAPVNYEYGDTASLTVDGGSGGNSFNILATGGRITTALNTGTGNDTVNVLATSGILNINGENGNDVVTIGSLAPSLGGTLTKIAGPVNVSNTSGGTTLRVDDSGDTVRKTATLTDGQLTGLAPAAISWTPTASTAGGVNFLDILGGRGGNTFNVANTSNLDFGTRVQTGTGNDKVNVKATTGVLSVYNNAGSDTVTVGSLAPSLGGTLANINAYVVVSGSGPVAVTVDDSGDATGQAATLTRNAAGTNTLSGMSPAPIYYESNVTSLTIDAGSGNDSLTIAGPSTSTHLTYNGGAGSNTLVGPNINNTWYITSLNAGTLDGNITFSSVQNLTGGAGTDTYKFKGSSPSLAGTITDSGGVNKLDYSGYTGGPISVNLTTMAASLIDGGAPGGFIGTLSSLAGSPNTGDTLTAANTYNLWSITGPNAGKVNTFAYTGIENLMGGSNVDVFKFSAAGTEVNVNGGGAPVNQGDWLDYSGFASAVAVNLVTGSATNVNSGLAGSVTNIQNVHGGNALNTLTGNSQGNILIGGSAGGGTITGGAGRSLLIADKGGAGVTGGSGSDILIADSTTFDTMTTANELALMSILAEWQSADSYADRFGDINKGTAYAGGSHLNGNNLLVWGTTVKDNGSPDVAATVTAAPSLSALDWFFVDSNDIKVNYEAGEHVDNT